MHKLNLTPLDYIPNSAKLFDKIADLDWAIFVDSCRLDNSKNINQQTRYDIITALPFKTLQTQGQTTLISSQGREIESAEDPFTLIKQEIDLFKQSTHSEIPFAGGAMGYFGYDLGRRIESLPSIAQRDIPIPEMMIGLYDWAIVVDHHQHKTWLASYHVHPQTHETIEHIKQRLDRPNRGPESFSLTQPFQTNMTKQQYSDAFFKVKNYILAGDIYQVNLSQRFQATYQGSLWAAYQKLRQNNPSPFAAYLNFPNINVLSLSPERFLKTHHGVVETKPIKGTRPRCLGNPVEDTRLAKQLLTSEKDRAENLMIVDLLRNDLGKTCKIGSIKVPKLFALESFPAVHHLVSTISAELAADKHSLDLLRGCFPGGSITGAPKVRAMQISEELEPQRRSIYCGSIGYIGFDGNMDTNICIRTLIGYDNRLYCSAGGALVADSDVDDEYQETLTKISLLMDILSGLYCNSDSKKCAAPPYS